MSEDLIESDVKNVFSITDGTRVDEAAASPVAAKAKTPRASRMRRRRPRSTERQLPVICKGAGKYGDLEGLEGILTVDYRDGEPYEATFDPADEGIDNAVIPIYGWKEEGGKVGVRSETTSWRFDVIEPDLS